MTDLAQQARESAERLEAGLKKVRFYKYREARLSDQDWQDLETLTAWALAFRAAPPVEESYAAFQQRRGRLPDLIEDAIKLHADFMADDNYDAYGCLGKIVAKLKEARDFYDATPPRAPALDREAFGYWVEQKHAEPVLLRKPAYIPEPSDIRTVTPLYALPAEPVQEMREVDEDEAYEIGKREGYEQAVQDIDLRTGGDGEYFASTIPGRGCPDAPTMIAGIVERFEAKSTPSTSSQIERAWQSLRLQPCETVGLEDMEAGCCAPCRARAALLPSDDGAREVECAASPFGRHQVDTSMESGPNNCFFCEKPMGGR